MRAAAPLASSPPPARARAEICVCTDKGNKNWGVTPGVYTGVVNLETGSVTTWDYLPDAMPMRGGSSWMATMKLAKEDPRIIEALARRGITDVDKVVMEPWPTGPTAKTFENAPFDYSETDPVWKDELGKYTAYIHMWLREDSDLDNYYAHPIDGLKAVVDIGGMEILSVEDTDDSIPVPMELNNYAKQYLPEDNPKAPPKPIEILQPEGASFTVDEGNKLEWMGWDLTIGFNAREGLTLHSIGFTEPGTTERRSICYRASVAEMVVPYGSPNRGLWRKSVFDTGEAGLGKAVNALELGCDCLGNIHYLDVPMVEEDGSVDVKKNAICIHEEDDGILWKHKGSSKCNGRLGPWHLLPTLTLGGRCEQRAASTTLRSTCGAPPASSSHPSPPWATTSTDSSGSSCLTARSSARFRPPASSRPPPASPASRRSTSTR